MSFCDQHKDIKEDLKEIKSDVKKLLSFRSYLLGAGVVISGVISFLVGIFNK